MHRKLIHFHTDELKELQAEPFHLCVNTPHQLVCALNAMVPGFEKLGLKRKAFYIIATDPEGNKVVHARNADATLRWSDDITDIHLVPVIEGAEPATIAIAAGFVAGTTAYYVAVFVITIAMNFAIGMILQMLAPTPKGGANREAADNTPSFLFNGAVNVQEQGYMHPIVFGIHECGSVVVSVATSTEDMLPEVLMTPFMLSFPPPLAVLAEEFYGDA